MGKCNENWFCDWFDTKYYHLLYKNRNESEAEFFIENLINFLQPTSDSKILDLACGKGRHSIKINQLGFSVTGIDLSKNSIDIAKKAANNRLSFAVHDMREPFQNNEFDFVFNLFTSFGYFNDDNDNLKVLKAVSNNLKPRGYFVLDFLNARKVVEELIPYEEKNIEGITFKITKTFENHVIRKEIEFTDKDRNYHFEERVSAFSKVDIERLFEGSNLETVHCFGDYKLNQFNEQESDRLIMIAKKV